jgi:hypothetical protein
MLLMLFERPVFETEMAQSVLTRMAALSLCILSLTSTFNTYDFGAAKEYPFTHRQPRLIQRNTIC